MKFAGRRFGERVEEAWQQFNMGDVSPFLDERPPSLANEDQIFMPYFLFHWDPDDPQADESREPRGGLLARAYVRERAYEMPAMERALLGQAMTRPMSFYEVLGSTPGERVAVRDVLIGEEFEVVEHAGSQSLRKGDLVYGQFGVCPGSQSSAARRLTVSLPAGKPMSLCCATSCAECNLAGAP